MSGSGIVVKAAGLPGGFGVAREIEQRPTFVGEVNEETRGEQRRRSHSGHSAL